MGKRTHLDDWPHPISDVDEASSSGYCGACWVRVEVVRGDGGWSCKRLLDAKRRLARQTRRDLRNTSIKRRDHVERTYNLPWRDYLRMLDEQRDACAICRKPFVGRTPHVDHDHACCDGPRSCGACVRGILCAQCNRNRR